MAEKKEYAVDVPLILKALQYYSKNHPRERKKLNEQVECWNHLYGLEKLAEYDPSLISLKISKGLKVIDEV